MVNRRPVDEQAWPQGRYRTPSARSRGRELRRRCADHKAADSTVILDSWKRAVSPLSLSGGAAPILALDTEPARLRDLYGRHRFGAAAMRSRWSPPPAAK